MFARVAVEGVFGVVPEMQRGIIHITPGFPRDWKEAAITTPDVSYSFRAAEGRVDLDVTTEREAAIHFRIPLDHAATAEARVNGTKVDAKLTAGIGTTWCDVIAGKAPEEAGGDPVGELGCGAGATGATALGAGAVVGCELRWTVAGAVRAGAGEPARGSQRSPPVSAGTSSSRLPS